MKALAERIRSEGQALGGGILKVDGFINHQLDPTLTMQMGLEFAQRFARRGVVGVSKVVTAEVSGIAPAFATGVALGVPVIYARKTQPITMRNGALEASAPSPTKGGVTRLIVSPEYLKPHDRVLLVDDFLASGKTLLALADLIGQCGATLVGVGCVIEKSFEGGRALLAPLGVPVVTLAVVTRLTPDTVEVLEGDD